MADTAGSGESLSTTVDIPRASETERGELRDAAWIMGYRALASSPARPPTRAMLRRWPQALHYQQLSLQPRGRLARLLGCRDTIVGIVMDDGTRTVMVARHPWWCLGWPFAMNQSVTVGSSNEEPGAER